MHCLLKMRCAILKASYILVRVPVRASVPSYRGLVVIEDVERKPRGCGVAEKTLWSCFTLLCLQWGHSGSGFFLLSTGAPAIVW